MGIVMLVSIIIPVFVAIVSLIAGKIFLRLSFKKVNRLNTGWEKLYKKLLLDGWVPPEDSRWFKDYLDIYHPKFNPERCSIFITEEE